MRIATAIGIPNRQNPALGALFTPKSLSGIVIWLRGDKGTTIATGVSNWADTLSGGGLAVAQGTGAAQPTLTANNAAFNNRATVNFDGVDDFLQGAFALVQPEDVYIVMRWNAAFSAVDTVMDGNAGDTARVQRTSAAGLRQRSGGGAPSNIDYAGQTPTSVHVYRFLYNGASTQPFTDGVAAAGATNLGAAAMTGLTLGGFPAGAQVGNVSMAEVIIYNRQLSTQEAGQLTAYLRSEYSIP